MCVSSTAMDDEEVGHIHDDDSDTDLDLFSGSPEIYSNLGVPLYRAALEGDWETAERILSKDRNLARARISKMQDTALHIAAAARRIYFVRKLVEFYLDEEDVALQNSTNNTALCLAAAAGTVEIAKVLLAKNLSLPLIRGNEGMTPLHMATLLGHRNMVWYLITVTNLNELTEVERYALFIASIKSDLYDVALELLRHDNNLALYQEEGSNDTALHTLAQKHLKPSSIQAGFCTKWIRKCCNYLARQNDDNLIKDEAQKLVRKLWREMTKLSYEDISRYFGSPTRLLFSAAEIGNIEFIAILIESYPDLIWKVNEEGVSIFHIAVSHRHVEVFNLIFEIGAIKDLLAAFEDVHENNMLHLAAMEPPPGSVDRVSGAALQMQRELMWYKEVEEIVQPHFRESKNGDGKTPRSLFIENHKDLRKEGEEWMKATANSCSLVAALIATVAFTAAFTVPGGNDQNKGTPLFQRDVVFVVFTIADALSLFSSSIAMLMFLGILTSRYAQKNFLRSLPLKLLIGLSTLFFSIAFMMVAFALTFFIIFKAGVPWISIPVIVAILAAVPVVVFAFGQFRLLIDIYRSTYQARYLFRPKTPRIFKEKKYDTVIKRLTRRCLGKEY